MKKVILTSFMAFLLCAGMSAFAQTAGTSDIKPTLSKQGKTVPAKGTVSQAKTAAVKASSSKAVMPVDTEVSAAKKAARSASRARTQKKQVR